MATLRLLVTSGHPGYPRIQPAPAGWRPYSWPPESARMADSGTPGLHTAQTEKVAVLGFSEVSERNVRKVRGGARFQAGILLKRVPNERFSRRVFPLFSVFFRVFRIPFPAPCSAFLSWNEESALLSTFFRAYEWGRLNPSSFTSFSRVFSCFLVFPRT